MADELQKGLEGVLVAESALSYIDGDEGELVYRGYAIEDLARDASYEEVLYLLWHGHLPDREEYESFTAEMAGEREVAEGVLDGIRELAARDERPMAALRSAASMLSAYDPEADADEMDADAAFRKGRRITAKLPTVLAAYDRIRQGEEPIAPREDLGLAANFLYMLHGEEPDPVNAETMDQALILHADHGLNASTFTSMVVASTYADMYNSIVAGIAALSGPWHGGANEDVMEVLFELDESGQDPVDWVREYIDAGNRVPGWGHRVYNVKDPRANVLQSKLEELSEATGNWTWYDYATNIEEYLVEEAGFPEKGLAPNVDFFSGSVYTTLEIPMDLFTPIFAMSRAGGWVGHVLEYQEDNRLIRPRARYVGEKDRTFVPLDER